MSELYELFIRHEVYSAMRHISQLAQTKICDFAESLLNDPFQLGDYSEPDDTGRACQVRIIGKHAVYFWVDHAVKEIKIVDLLDADHI